MISSNLRKYLLTTLSILNLICWIGLACTAGLLLSDSVNLGFETLLREGQATAVAAWQRRATPNTHAPPVEAAAVAPILQATTPTTELVPSAVPSSPAVGATPSTAEAPVASATTISIVAADATSPTTVRAPVASPRPLATAWQPPSPTAWPVSRTRVAASATPTRTAAPESSPITVPDVLPAAVRPTQALQTTPLLLADPAFADLSMLNAEMDRSAPGRAVQIRYREEALNREIAGLLANNPDLPYRDVTIDLKRDSVVVTGNAIVLGFQVSAVIEGVLTAYDCQPQFEIKSVSLASIVTPGFVKGRVGEMLQEAMAWYPADYALCLEQIVLEETKASIYGIRR